MQKETAFSMKKYWERHDFLELPNLIIPNIRKYLIERNNKIYILGMNCTPLQLSNITFFNFMKIANRENEENYILIVKKKHKHCVCFFVFFFQRRKNTHPSFNFFFVNTLSYI